MEEVATGAVRRDARQRSGLSQTELARRAKVAQSVISAYESGRREPGLSMLSRLVAATGQRLTLGLETAGTRTAGIRDRWDSTPLGPGCADYLRPDSSGGCLVVDLAPGSGSFGLATSERELQEIVHVDGDVDVPCRQPQAAGPCRR